MNERVRAATPLGEVVVEMDGSGGIRRLAFAARGDALPERDARLEAALASWFESGRLPAGYAIVPGGTPFQCRVWQAAAAVERGSTRSYRELARDLGQPAAARAVARALAGNPVLLLVPCHRIVGSDGRLRGYAGGLARKRELLRIERRRAA